MRLVFISLFFLSALFSCQKKTREEAKVLIFSRTANYQNTNNSYRHASIPDGIALIQDLGEANGFQVDTTEDARNFNEANLKQYSAVIFLNTIGDALDLAQQADFERYIQAGGGYVGIHSASDTEYGWPWYGKLVGAYFDFHPDQAQADMKVKFRDHPSTNHLPATWSLFEEWYNFREGSLNEEINVLIEVDESSYEGGSMGEFHPMSWFHDYDGGRSFYTALGHRPETFQEELFQQHLLGGIQYAIGDNLIPDYSQVKSARVPTEDRFSRIVLDQVFDEPMELEVLGNGDVLFIQRKGEMMKYYASEGETRQIAKLEVHEEFEDGLLGMALDPDFEENNWVYLFYSPPIDEPIQYVSRFDLIHDSLHQASEKVVLRIPVQRDECCHSAGSLEFTPEGDLFISVGDDTNPFESNGYAPIDDRAGRKPFDARRSSSNTMDLRGKILRIHPEEDGSYTIPDGNLFSKDGTVGRPEIYVMGCRNPFRHAYDHRRGFLYWGDVGPDAGFDSTGRGPKGHDEVNQARQAGYFGWPLFVGNNKPYNAYDFATKVSGDFFDPAKPINESANNTGARELPPANPAFIWYPYGPSEEFPMLRSGSRNAMAGPFYYEDRYRHSQTAFPAYYDGKVLIFDWMRGWLFYVSLDEHGDKTLIEPFLPSHKFSNPIDMQFGPDGALYVLEYGTGWFLRNSDAKLSRIEFHAGNRPPVADIKSNKLNGPLPLTINFSGEKSKDPDGYPLTYKWWFDGAAVQSREAAAEFTFEKPGRYDVMLKVTDQEGATHNAYVEVLAGNEAPEVSWEIDGNQTFYWPGEPIRYAVKVKDLEDGELGKGIETNQVTVSVDYLAESRDIVVASLGHQTKSASLTAEQLLEDNNCVSCHKFGYEVSAGPGYQSVADKYQAKADAVSYLAGKIRNGGNGVWGEQQMPAQVQLSEDEARRIARFILDLGSKKAAPINLPPTGQISTASNHDGYYFLQASYTDKGGNGVGSLSSNALLELRSPKIEAEEFDASSYVIIRGGTEGTWLKELVHGSYVSYSYIDFTNISRILFGFKGIGGGQMELRLDGVDGPIIGKANFTQGSPNRMLVTLEPVKGMHDLYLVFKNDDDQGRNIAEPDWFEFQR